MTSLPPVSRRAVIGAGAASLATASLAQTSRHQRPHVDGDCLDALARRKGLRFGSEVGLDELTDARLCNILLAECGVITPGNELKWPETEPQPGRFSFAAGDKIASFAKRHGLLMRGHTLLFLRSNSLPAWLTRFCAGDNPRSPLERIISSHVATECAHYPHIPSWDVVNEAIDPATGTFRQSDLMTAMGPEVIDLLFHTARAAAPQAQLVYNDYMAWERSSKAHRAGVLKLLADLRKRGVPVDAVGLQSHIGPRPGDIYPGSVEQRERDWRQFLDELTAMGFAVLITELDVLDNNIGGDARERDRLAADYLRSYLDVTLSYPQVKAVVSWGMVDKYSWRGKIHPRSDGLPSHPLPYGDDYRPKPLREAIASAFRAAPSRS
jgi:endo-1,4-beta-xylanase